MINTKSLFLSLIRLIIFIEYLSIESQPGNITVSHGEKIKLFLSKRLSTPPQKNVQVKGHSLISSEITQQTADSAIMSQRNLFLLRVRMGMMLVAPTQSGL